MLFLLALDNKWWAPKAHINNIQQGDANTKFFHIKHKLRSHRNQIRFLVSPHNANQVLTNPNFDSI